MTLAIVGSLPGLDEKGSLLVIAPYLVAASWQASEATSASKSVMLALRAARPARCSSSAKRATAIASAEAFLHGEF